MKTRYVVRIIGPFWSKKVVIVVQVQDPSDGPDDWRGCPLWLGPYWRDATIADLMETKQ